jgi:glutaconate CoA-transferase subunit A
VGAAFEDIDGLVARIADGATVTLPSAFSADISGASMVATRALIKRGVRNLKLVCVPGGSLQADMLIGAGCVTSVETGSMLLYEYGPASRFVEAQREGTIAVKDSTCPAIHASLIAGEKGLPFLPLRGVLGSDILKHRSGEWRVIDNPFSENDPIVLIPALRPDATLLHVPFADREGNVWISQRTEFQTLARGANVTLVTFDAFYDGNLLDDRTMAPGVVPAMYVTALSHQPNGSWPLLGGETFPEDVEHMREYARLARTAEGFRQYLATYVFGHRGEIAHG